MKKALIGIIFLVTACGVGAQEEISMEGPTNAGASFREGLVSPVTLFATSGAGDFALASAEPAPAPAEPMPRYLYGDRSDYRWQLGVGVEVFRFRSDIINSTMAGLNATLTYYTNSWFALEGNVVTGFAPEIYEREHVKLFGGGGGIRIGGRRARWEPWAHVLAGGSHLQPQTAEGSRNSLMVQAGGGADFRVNSRLSLRGEGDWVCTRYFSQTQNNFQGFAGLVLHF